MIVFTTPKFCTSQVCGPKPSIIKHVAARFPRVNFVHVEPYEPEEVSGKLERVPAVTKWGLPLEPWVLVTDARGRLAAKYEGSVAPKEVQALLRRL